MTHLARRAFTLALAFGLLFGLLGAPTPARAEVDIYITPGHHELNGRQWRTTCEPYSQT